LICSFFSVEYDLKQGKVNLGGPKMKKLVLPIFCLAITGCTSVEQREQQLTKRWIGKDPNSLVASIGAPDRVTDDDFGGRIYIYNIITHSKLPDVDRWQPTKGIYISKRGWHYNRIQDTRAYPPRTFVKGRKISFGINPSGQIYSVSIDR
jgi:hypothetical protein